MSCAAYFIAANVVGAAHLGASFAASSWTIGLDSVGRVCAGLPVSGKLIGSICIARVSGTLSTYT